MAKLIECPACKKKISIEAESCPKCGQPITDAIRDEAVKKEIQDKKDNRYGCILMIILIIAFAVWMESCNKGSSDTKSASSEVVAIVKGSMKNPGEMGSCSTGPEVYGGTPVIVDGNGYYWIKDGQIYAVNGVAMGMSPNIRKSPPSVDFNLIDNAIKSGKEVPLPPNMGIDALTFQTDVNANLKDLSSQLKAKKILQAKKSTFYSCEIEEKGKTVGAMTFEEAGGMVTSVRVNIAREKGTQAATLFLLAVLMKVDPSLVRMDQPIQDQPMSQFMKKISENRGKELSEIIAHFRYKGFSEKEGFFELTITPAE